jgi:DNA-binding CsgD family transcriptional regulator/tetratricopeptide (TPR) repeat protein
LVGRREQTRAFEQALAACTSGGQSWALTGDAGIGKSVLLEHTRCAARERGYRVLSTTGIQSEAGLPYAGLHRVLGPSLGRAAELPEPQRRALEVALGIAGEGEAEPFLVSLATLTLLSTLAADQPVLVSVDDVQWLDLPTQNALVFIARRLDAEPVMLVGAVRNGHRPSFVEACTRHIELGSLSDADSRTVLSHHAPDLPSAEIERVLSEALGNPLALVELPAAWRSTVPLIGDPAARTLPLTARLERAFAARLDELEPSARDLLLIAATDSENGLVEILTAAALLSGQPVGADDVEACAGDGLITFDRHTLRFQHPLVRSAVVQAEPLPRRQAAHRALAEVLANDPYRRVWHRAEAIVGPDDRVADELEYAHAIALRRGAALAAVAALERAAQLTTDSRLRGRRLLLAAEHAFGLGRADMVNTLLAAAGRNELSDLDLDRMEWLREIFNDGVPGDADRVIELCRVARDANRAGDNDLALNLLLGAALRCWWADTGSAARRHVVDTVRWLGVPARDPRYIAVLAVADPVEECNTVEDLLALVAIESVADANELRLYGMAAHAVGDLVRAVDFLDRAEVKVREQGRLGLLSHVIVMAGNDRMQLGDWQRARVALEEAQQIARETGQPIWDAGTMALSAIAQALRGEYQTAHATAAQAELLANGRRLNNLLTSVQLARGYAYAGEGRYAEAYPALRRVFDPADPAHHQRESFHGIMVFAEAAAHTGQFSDARAILEDLEQLGKISSSPVLHNQLLYARAMLADDDEAEGLFLAGLGADLVRWPWTKARLQLAYGAWLRRQRRAATSRTPLREALSAFEAIGAPAWADQARQELRAAGERTAPSDQSSARDVLSAQELQIALMAAEGLSNRQIGERLFLSPRTVGSHLYRIFPKLGITSRSQLAGRLGGQ